MRIVEQKGWKAKEYFIQYTGVKIKISEVQFKLDYIEDRGIPMKSSQKTYEELQEEMNELVKELKMLLGQLNIEGISHEDLILLSMNLEPNDYK